MAGIFRWHMMKTVAAPRRGVAQRQACGHSFGRREGVLARSAAARETIHSDYVVLGAGIIGLSCARALLQAEPEASVTVLEQAQPAFEAPSDDGPDNRLHLQNTTTATGAGQGCVLCYAMRCSQIQTACSCASATASGPRLCRYIWMGHRDPKNEAIWKLAARGVALWKAEAASITRCVTANRPAAIVADVRRSNLQPIPILQAIAARIHASRQPHHQPRSWRSRSAAAASGRALQ